MTNPDTTDAATAETGSSARAEEPEGFWGQAGQSVGDVYRGLKQEGVMGLLDPRGMMDRQQAQRDLSDRFQVIPDDFKGERKGNMVTQAEFEATARTFSDIRLSRGDLTLDSSGFDDDSDPDNEQSDAMRAQAQQWEDGVMTNIADIMMTEGGRAQIQRMSRNRMVDDEGNLRRDENGKRLKSHDVTIKPMFRRGTTPAQQHEGNLEPVDMQAIPEDSRWHDFHHLRSDAFRRDSGERGLGNDSTVYFNPVVNLGGLNPDVVLAHELQHARNHTQGSMAHPVDRERQAMGLPIDGSMDHPADEFTENDYREQRNALGLGDRYLPRTTHNVDRLNPPKAEADTDAELEAAWQAHRENVGEHDHHH